MQGRDFYSEVQQHSDLEWLGAKQGDSPAEDQVLIGHKTTCSKFAVSVSTIGDHSWDEFQAVLTGQRSPRVMTHITRIVGYYSQLQNWNRSKLAELRDRHKGDYAIPEVASHTAQPQPSTVTSAVA